MVELGKVLDLLVTDHSGHHEVQSWQLQTTDPLHKSSFQQNMTRWVRVEHIHCKLEGEVCKNVVNVSVGVDLG